MRVPRIIRRVEPQKKMRSIIVSKETQHWRIHASQRKRSVQINSVPWLAPSRLKRRWCRPILSKESTMFKNALARVRRESSYQGAHPKLQVAPLLSNVCPKGSKNSNHSPSGTRQRCNLSFCSPHTFCLYMRSCTGQMHHTP